MNSTTNILIPINILFGNSKELFRVELCSPQPVRIIRTIVAKHRENLS